MDIKNRKKLIAILAFALAAGLIPVLKQKLQSAYAEPVDPILEIGELVMLQGNSLAQAASPQNPDLKVVGQIHAVITAYSSTPWETDDDPFVTAAGTAVRNGIVANNLLPFGTKIRIPDIYGDRIFVIEDRMHSRKGNNHFDIWFENTKDAKNFGVKIAKIEILQR